MCDLHKRNPLLEEVVVAHNVLALSLALDVDLPLSKAPGTPEGISGGGGEGMVLCRKYT